VDLYSGDISGDHNSYAILPYVHSRNSLEVYPPLQPGYLNGTTFNRDEEYFPGDLRLDGDTLSKYKFFSISGGTTSLPLVQKRTHVLWIWAANGATAYFDQAILTVENLIDPCDPNPCQNGGACTPDGSSFTCDCSGTGYSGAKCEGCVSFASPYLLFFSTTNQVVLTMPPQGTAKVFLYGDCVTFSPCTLTFTPENWDIPQTFAIFPQVPGETPTQTPGFSQIVYCPYYAELRTEGICDGDIDTAWAGAAGPEEVVDVSNRASFAGRLSRYFTFDGVSESNWALGDFYYVRGLAGDFVIQTRQEACGVATCVTGVAVKYQSLVFYVLFQTSVPVASVVGDPADTSTIITADSLGFHLTFVNGIRVDINPGSKSLSMLVACTAPRTLLNELAGLAGFFSDNFLDDLTKPDGTLAATPEEFQNSWRIPLSENLFVDETVTFANITSLFPSNPSPLPKPTTTCPAPDPEDVGESLQTTESPAANTTVPPSETLDVPSCESANATMQADAEAFCSPFFNDSAALCCKALGVSADEYYSNCICDHIILGDSVALSSLDPFYAECDTEAEGQNTTCSVCPNACNNQGTCLAGGTCDCNPGFDGIDCSEDWTTAPTIVSVSPTSEDICPKTITILGNGFFGSNITCTIDGSTPVAANKVSNSQLVCPIPPIGSPGPSSHVVKVTRSDGMMSSDFPFTVYPTCCESFCSAGSNCTNGGSNGFTCTCPDGFSGDLCDIIVPQENITVTLKVAGRRYSGSGGLLSMTLIGSLGNSQPLNLGNAFGEGEERIIADLVVFDLGELYAIQLNNDRPSDGLRLKSAEFSYKGTQYFFGTNIMIRASKILNGTSSFPPFLFLLFFSFRNVNLCNFS